MLSPKPWKLHAVARLLISIFICIFCGSLVMAALHFKASARVSLRTFIGLCSGSALLLFVALVMLVVPWNWEKLRGRIFLLLLSLYAGLILAWFAQNLAGPPPPSGLVSQLIVATLSFQGASLVLIALFLREHRIGPIEAFGLGNRSVYAVPIGILVACVFLYVGLMLQQLSGQLLSHVLHLKPQEQQAVQTLRVATSVTTRVVLGIVTVLLAPVAEELLFRGIIYPWIKQAGFPQLALWGSSLLFAAAHLNLVTFLPLFVLALVLTVLYEKTNNLLSCITAHAVFNGLNFASLYLFDKAH